MKLSDHESKIVRITPLNERDIYYRLLKQEMTMAVAFNSSSNVLQMRYFIKPCIYKYSTITVFKIYGSRQELYNHVIH